MSTVVKSNLKGMSKNEKFRSTCEMLKHFWRGNEFSISPSSVLSWQVTVSTGLVWKSSCFLCGIAFSIIHRLIQEWKNERNSLNDVKIYICKYIWGWPWFSEPLKNNSDWWNRSLAPNDLVSFRERSWFGLKWLLVVTIVNTWLRLWSNHGS